MKINVLGPGCPKCEELAESATEVATELGIDFTLEKVKDFNDILAFGVMVTPSLVIDNEVKCVGRVPTRDELKEMMS